jgi:sporulation protein YlmC with PRC-barrel domain
MLNRPHHPGPIGPILTGRTVLDEYGLRLGSVTEVVFEPDGHDPEYLVVKPGPFRRARYVPARGACQTNAGEVVVAWDRDWFRLAPTAPAGPTMPPSRRAAATRHYARP